MNLVSSAALEDTISDLQAQIERLSSSVREWLDTRDQLDDRHAHAVAQVEARLGEWSSIENRLQQESVQRIRELEQKIEHEWKALRDVHEAPAQQLREQAAALGETCVAAANLALRGFERVEARFAALETDLQERLSQLSRDVQAAIAEMRRDAGRRGALGPGVEPFPLQGIMRIHEELRDGTAAPADSAPRQLTAAIVDVPITLPAAGPEGPGLHVTGQDAAAPSSGDGLRRYALIVGGTVVVIAIVVGVIVQRQVSAQLANATSRAAAAERQSQAASDAATRQIAATRAEADRQIAEAHQAALKAEIVSNLLAAPDLIRFSLTGSGDAARAYAQLLWSRTRGMVLSGVRMPAPPNGGTYQLWLLTDTDPVSAGLFVPDASGRITLATDTAPNIPRRVTGAAVTLEPPGGGSSPSGITVLARAQQ